MAEGLKKIINLVKKAGDKCVVLDEEGNPAYVIMSFQDYERLTVNSANVGDLTENEFLEKINQDIANWKANQESQLDGWQSLESVIEGAKTRIIESKIEENPLNQAENEEIEDKYYFEPIE